MCRCHALGGFVDFDQKAGVGGLAKNKHRDDGGGQRRDEAADKHSQALQPPMLGRDPSRDLPR